MTFSMHEGPSSSAAVQDVKAGASLATVPAYLRGFCLTLPQSSQPARTTGLSRAERQVLGDFAQAFLDSRGPAASLDYHLAQTYQGGTADLAKAALVRRGLLHEDTATRGVLPTRVGMQCVWNDGVARARLADQGRNLFMATDFSFVVTQASEAFLLALKACGKDGVAYLGAVAQELGGAKVEDVISVVRKLNEAQRIRVEPAGNVAQCKVVDVLAEAMASVGDTLRVRPLRQPKVPKERAKPKEVMPGDPAALITQVVRDAGSKGISVRQIRASLEATLPKSELSNGQLFGFLSNASNGFTSERLDERSPDGALVLYRVAPSNSEAK